MSVSIGKLASDLSIAVAVLNDEQDRLRLELAKTKDALASACADRLKVHEAKQLREHDTRVARERCLELERDIAVIRQENERLGAESNRAEALYTENQRLNKVLAEQTQQIADLKVQVSRLLEGPLRGDDGPSGMLRRIARLERFLRLNFWDNWLKHCACETEPVE